MNTLPRLKVCIDGFVALRSMRGSVVDNRLDLMEIVQDIGLSGAGAYVVDLAKHNNQSFDPIGEREIRTLRSKIDIPLCIEVPVLEADLDKIRRISPESVCLQQCFQSEQSDKVAAALVKSLQKKNINIVISTEPVLQNVKKCIAMKADAVELNAGKYVSAVKSETSTKINSELNRIWKAGRLAQASGLAVHAGHGLDYGNIRGIVDLTGNKGISLVQEYRIGYSVLHQAAVKGLGIAVREMVATVSAP